MLVIYSLASLVVATSICIVAGAKRPWLVQFSFAAVVVASLATASKIVPTSFGTTASVAVGLYSMTFLMANFLREIYGKSAAIVAIQGGFIGSFIFVFATQFAIIVPGAEFWQNQTPFEIVFGIAPRIFLASITAFVIAELADVYVYQFLMNRTSGRHLWLRNNVGTITGQTLDTIIFYTIAFYGIVPNLIWLILGTILIKILISLATTPAIYLARHIALRGEKTYAVVDPDLPVTRK